MPRRLHHSVAVLLLAVALSSCSADRGRTDLVTADDTTVPTTAPISVPTDPTPTAFSLPALRVPLSTPTAVATTEPTSAPQSTPTPASVAADPDPTAVPEASEAPTPVTEPTTSGTSTPGPESGSTPDVTVQPTAVPSDESTVTPADGERLVTDVGYRPLGQASSVSLRLPVAMIEIIGFHEAGHPGAQAINAAGTGVDMITLESRGRGTPDRSAADIVVPPGAPVVAPATGTIIAANQYILYCEHDDRLVYIEPDGLPGWQVRVFHVVGEAPPVGTRVVAGETQIATSARQLPFESQVDEFTGEPSWPHVHVEVVDTSVPDTRPPGPGCP